jgi:hypothetical protein
MKTYKIQNQINKEVLARTIVNNNKRSRKYRYTFEQAMEWVETLPNKGEEIDLENAQCTSRYSALFSHWGTQKVGYTYCLSVNKWVDEKGIRKCTISLGTQQTVGRKHYSINPDKAW